MARDERIRVFGEDVADADPHVLDEVPGKGGVFGITFGLQRAFGDARCFNTPLAEANIIGRAVGQADPRAAAVPRDPVLRLHLAGDEPAQVRGGDDPLALERRVHLPDGRADRDRRLPARAARSGTASAASRSSPTSPGCSIAFPSRARDAAGLLRTAFRCEDPVLFLEHKHLYRQGYNRDPMPPRRLDAAVRHAART